MKNKILTAVMGTVIAVTMMGCGGSSSSNAVAPATDSTSSKEAPASSKEAPASSKEVAESKTPKEDEKKLKIGISVDQLFESRVATVMGIEGAGEAAGVEMVELVADGDAQSQNDQINELINQGVDGLLVCPVDLNTIETALIAAKAANIPVVLYDRDSPKSKNALTAVTCGATDDGYQGGKYIAEQLDKMGKETYKIAELKGPLNDDIGVQRSAGFNKAITEVLGDKAKVVVIDTGAWDTPTALANLQSSYQANPDFDGIFCGTDSFFPACETVLSDLGKLKLVGEDEHVIITGINGSKEGYDAVVAGKADGTVVMNCGETGKIAMNTLLDFMNNNKTPERQIIVPSSFYTKENIEANKDTIWGVMELGLHYQ